MKYHRFIHSQEYSNTNNISLDIFKNLTNSNFLITKIKINYNQILSCNIFRKVNNFLDESVFNLKFDENNSTSKFNGINSKDTFIVLQKNESINLSFNTPRDNTNNVKFLVEIFYIDMDENK